MCVFIVQQWSLWFVIKGVCACLVPRQQSLKATQGCLYEEDLLSGGFLTACECVTVSR